MVQVRKNLHESRAVAPRTRPGGCWGGIGMILSLLSTASVLLLASCVAVGSPPVTYTVTPGKKDARVTYHASGGDVTVEVRSPSGIGSAHLSQTGGGVPASLTIRLYLKGLEQLTFEYPGVTVMASISTHDGSVSESVSVNGGAEQPISPDSPYWMPVKIVAPDTAIPLKDGYFEAQAPRDFLATASREFTVRWIDFYRG